MKAILVLTAAAVAAATLTATSQAHDARTLSDAHVGTSKQELIAQRNYSYGVLRRLSTSWKVAPRHATCWSHVPWAKVCDRTRRKMLAHRWLYHLAARRLSRLYPSRPREMSGSVAQIICSVFGPYCSQALAVATCESHLSTGATNGQYLGIFQMGEHERAAYARLGYATAYEQVVAAHGYFSVAGWGPWSCRP